MAASNLLCFCSFLFFLTGFIPFAASESFDYPMANLSTRWTNGDSLPHSVTYSDGTSVRAILLRGSLGQSFALGFYCSPPCTSFLLSLFLVYTNSGSGITNSILAPPQVLWSPHRSRPVRARSSLSFSTDGDLALFDADSSLIWSTNTSGRAVAGLNLTEDGNLVLFDRDNVSVWQSFDHPTDTLVVGQSLTVGQRLTANVSATNSSTGQLFLTVHDDGLSAYVDSNPPQMYFGRSFKGTKKATYLNGSLALFATLNPSKALNDSITLPRPPSMQYMRLEHNGHLRVYSWIDSTGWSSVDVFNIYPDDCMYPTVCGAYGICSNGQQCSCPTDANTDVPYFQQVDGRLPSLGCVASTPLTCQSIQNHQLLAFDDVSYFNYADFGSAIDGIGDEASCKQTCLMNCSCKAAFFRYAQNKSSGSCYLLSQVFSMINNQPEVTHYNSSAFIKVQINPKAISPSPNSASPSGKGEESSNFLPALGSVLGGLFVAFLNAAIAIFIWKKEGNEELEEDDLFDGMAGMPTRFSFEELKTATESFSTKLGEGGFGSVFAGTLADGTKVAVKRLDGIGQGEKEFLAEVQTIGSIHHINLVRLIGFSAEKTYRLLVYEHMCNGSLDKWIFYGNKNDPLDWHVRREIITDIAKGLSYLHEECRQRIAHLDIKPQNILLDDKFNAKVSDFGLSKLIDRDESQVMTRMRGTPGYLAPEWLTSIITEKVDVYSFGVVVMEIVCGRKNLDYSQSEENFHLMSRVQKMIEINRLVDLVDGRSSDMKLHQEEAVEIMKLALRCLQNDANRRPSMSTVVKVLEGSLSVEHNLDLHLDLSSPTLPMFHYAKHLIFTKPPLESILSGPR